MAKFSGATALVLGCASVLSVLTAAAQSPIAGAHRQDVYGWGKTCWGMSESEVKRIIPMGQWRPATKDEQEDDGHLYVPFVLQDVKVAGQRFIGLFGFDQKNRRLVRVTLHSGVPFIRPPKKAIAVFDRVVDELKKEFGPPAKIVRNNSGHTGFYADFAVWRFTSSVIELTCIRPNEAERAVVLSYAVPSEADR